MSQRRNMYQDYSSSEDNDSDVDYLPPSSVSPSTKNKNRAKNNSTTKKRSTSKKTTSNSNISRKSNSKSVKNTKTKRARRGSGTSHANNDNTSGNNNSNNSNGHIGSNRDGKLNFVFAGSCKDTENADATHITITFAGSAGDTIDSITCPTTDARFENMDNLYKSQIGKGGMMIKSENENNNNDNTIIKKPKIIDSYTNPFAMIAETTTAPATPNSKNKDNDNNNNKNVSNSNNNDNNENTGKSKDNMGSSRPTMHSRNQFRRGTCLFYCADEGKLFWAFAMRNTKRVTCQHFCKATNTLATRSLGLRSTKCNGAHTGSCISIVANCRPPPGAVNKQLEKTYNYRYHFKNEKVVLSVDTGNSHIVNKGDILDVNGKKQNYKPSLKIQSLTAETELNKNVKFVPNVTVINSFTNKILQFGKDDKFCIKLNDIENESVKLKVKNYIDLLHQPSINNSNNSNDNNNTSNSNMATNGHASDDNRNNVNNTRVNSNSQQQRGSVKRRFENAMNDGSNNNENDEIELLENEDGGLPKNKRARLSSNGSNKSKSKSHESNNNNSNNNNNNNIDLETDEYYSFKNILRNSKIKMKERDFNSVLGILNPILVNDESSNNSKDNQNSNNRNNDKTVPQINIPDMPQLVRHDSLGLTNNGYLRVYLDLAMCQFYMKNIDQALECCNLIIGNPLASMKVDFEARKIRARIYCQKGKFKDACEDYDYIMANNPYCPNWRDIVHRDELPTLTDVLNAGNCDIEKLNHIAMKEELNHRKQQNRLRQEKIRQMKERENENMNNNNNSNPYNSSNETKVDVSIIKQEKDIERPQLMMPELRLDDGFNNNNAEDDLDMIKEQATKEVESQIKNIDAIVKGLTSKNKNKNNNNNDKNKNSNNNKNDTISPAMSFLSTNNVDKVASNNNSVITRNTTKTEDSIDHSSSNNEELEDDDIVNSNNNDNSNNNMNEGLMGVGVPPMYRQLSFGDSNGMNGMNLENVFDDCMDENSLAFIPMSRGNSNNEISNYFDLHTNKSGILSMHNPQLSWQHSTQLTTNFIQPMSSNSINNVNSVNITPQMHSLATPHTMVMSSGMNMGHMHMIPRISNGSMIGTSSFLPPATTLNTTAQQQQQYQLQNHNNNNNNTDNNNANNNNSYQNQFRLPPSLHLGNSKSNLRRMKSRSEELHYNTIMSNRNISINNMNMYMPPPSSNIHNTMNNMNVTMNEEIKYIPSKIGSGVLRNDNNNNDKHNSNDNDVDNFNMSMGYGTANSMQPMQFNVSDINNNGNNVMFRYDNSSTANNDNTNNSNNSFY